MIRNSKGFGIVEAIIIVLAIGFIGFVGWRTWGVFSNSKTTNITQSQLINPDQAPTVNSAADLDRSTATLNAINIDSNESTQINSEFNF